MNMLEKGPGLFLLLLFSTLFLLLSGCATTPPPKESTAVFYPPPPALPRYQFLKSFTGAADIEEKPSAFDTFVTQAKDDNRTLVKPYGVAVYGDKIYVCDTGATVMIFDLAKKTFHPMPGDKGAGKLIMPLNISIDQDGTKYVADVVRRQVLVYDKNDLFVKTFTDALKKPTDAVPYGDRLYVADIEDHAVKVFRKDTGKLLKVIGKDGPPKSRLGLPTNLAFDRNGVLNVSDAGRFQIVRYDRDGHYLGEIGGPGRSSGHFNRPRGLAIDNHDLMYVVDAAYANVQVFEGNGQVLMALGGNGYDPGQMILPAGVAIDRNPAHAAEFQKYADPNFKIDYLVLVTQQYGLSRLDVYGFGRDVTKHYPTEKELKQLALKRLKELQKNNAKKESRGQTPKGQARD